MAQSASKLEKAAGEDLKKHLSQTQNMNHHMIDRELKMIQLKEEIAELKSKLPKES